MQHSLGSNNRPPLAIDFSEYPAMRNQRLALMFPCIDLLLPIYKIT